MALINLEKVKVFVGMMCIIFSILAGVVANGEKFFLFFLCAGVILIVFRRKALGSLLATSMFVLNLILYISGSGNDTSAKIIMNVFGVIIGAAVLSTCIIKK